MLICLDCGWSGDDTQLESKTEDLDDRNFSFCPDCGGDNFEEEDEDEDEEMDNKTSRIRELENTVLALRANEALPLSLALLRMLEDNLLIQARKLEDFGSDSLGNELRLARDKIQYVRSKLLEGSRGQHISNEAIT